MAMLFQTSGIPEVRRFLGLAQRAMRDPRPALVDIGEEMLVRNQNRLRRGVDVNGIPFKPSHRVGSGGGQTLWDSGALAASVHYAVPSGKLLDLFSSDKRARVHFEGLTIRPTGGKKFLTIPLRARGGMFDGAGVTAKGNRTGARAGHYKNAFFLRRGDRLFLMQKSGSGRLRALFLLVRSVKMPRREWMGFGPADVAMATEKLGIAVTGDKR